MKRGKLRAYGDPKFCLLRQSGATWKCSAYAIARPPCKSVKRERLTRAIKAAVGKVGIHQRLSAHTLRHSFATHLLQAGTDIRTVQELPGHSDVSTKMIYTYVLKLAAGSTIRPLDALEI